MRDVFVAGAGMTTFGKFMDRTVRSLAEEATADALADAGGDAGRRRDGVLRQRRGRRSDRPGDDPGPGRPARHGLLGVPIVNVENACASASSAFYLACMAVASGAVDIALAIGSEKLTHPDKMRSVRRHRHRRGPRLTASHGALSRRCWPRSPAVGRRRPAERHGTAGRRSWTSTPRMTRQYMERSGATAEDFARVAVKNHGNGALNPKAQYRDAGDRRGGPGQPGDRPRR